MIESKIAQKRSVEKHAVFPFYIYSNEYTASDNDIRTILRVYNNNNILLTMTKKEYKTLYNAIVNKIAQIDKDIVEAAEHNRRWNNSSSFPMNACTIMIDRVTVTHYRKVFELLGYTDIPELDAEIEAQKERLDYYQRWGKLME